MDSQLPNQYIDKLKDTHNIIHPIVPNLLTDGTYVLAVPNNLSADAVIATNVTSDDVIIEEKN